jgi:hypothetical protein
MIANTGGQDGAEDQLMVRAPNEAPLRRAVALVLML